MGELAQNNGQSDGVKSFGKMLSSDHAAANEKAIGAAKSLGMVPPTEPSSKQKADYDEMAKMSGAQFDKMFTKHMVADHEKDIAEYKKEAKIKDAAGEYAGDQLDTLQKHLDNGQIRLKKRSKIFSRGVIVDDVGELASSIAGRLKVRREVQVRQGTVRTPRR